MVICQVYIHPVFLSIIIKLIYNYRQQKIALKYLYSYPLINNNEFLSMNKLCGLVWSGASIYDF